jgi:hypothetical protein
MGAPRSTRQKRTAVEAMEPSKMAAVPKMDRVSVTFALMLDSFVIEVDDHEVDPYLTCNHCAERLCRVEGGDTMRVLFNTALAHSC